MSRLIRATLLSVLAIFAVAVLPPSSASAAPDTRTQYVIFLVNFTTPYRTKVIGTVVARRQCGNTPTWSAAIFRGTLNGSPRSYSGSMTERWSGNGLTTVQVVSTNIQGNVLGKPPQRTINFVQNGKGLIVGEGVPAAIDGVIRQPCYGRNWFIVTNPAQGATDVTELP